MKTISSKTEILVPVVLFSPQQRQSNFLYWFSKASWCSGVQTHPERLHLHGCQLDDGGAEVGRSVDPGVGVMVAGGRQWHLKRVAHRDVVRVSVGGRVGLVSQDDVQSHVDQSLRNKGRFCQ